YVFFFSSRRRHTRSTRDWSSDVCSSDLENSACRFLPWDSEFFGLRIAALELAAGAPVAAPSFERALAWCRSEAIDCLYLLAAARSEERRVGKEGRSRMAPEES